MNILHITPSTDGYEEVDLLANAMSKTNNLAAISKDKITYMTGGFLINDTPKIREILDNIPKSEQYNFVKEFKMDPFEKFYFEEEISPEAKKKIKGEELLKSKGIDFDEVVEVSDPFYYKEYYSQIMAETGKQPKQFLCIEVKYKSVRQVLEHNKDAFQINLETGYLAKLFFREVPKLKIDHIFTSRFSEDKLLNYILTKF